MDVWCNFAYVVLIYDMLRFNFVHACFELICYIKIELIYWMRKSGFIISQQNVVVSSLKCLHGWIIRNKINNMHLEKKNLKFVWLNFNADYNAN